jgi:hypothetical protein
MLISQQTESSDHVRTRNAGPAGTVLAGARVPSRFSPGRTSAPPMDYRGKPKEVAGKQVAVILAIAAGGLP